MLGGIAHVGDVAGTDELLHSPVLHRGCRIDHRCPDTAYRAYGALRFRRDEGYLLPPAAFYLVDDVAQG